MPTYQQDMERLTWAARNVANRLRSMLEGGCECEDISACQCGWTQAKRELEELDALLDIPAFGSDSEEIDRASEDPFLGDLDDTCEHGIPFNEECEDCEIEDDDIVIPEDK